MRWKNSKLIEATIKSDLGGNLRLRVPNGLKLSNGSALKKAMGENNNPFFRIEKTPAPIVSPKAIITFPKLKETFVYDISTQKGKTYTFVAK
jgi:alpha-L-fucosidase 2